MADNQQQNKQCKQQQNQPAQDINEMVKVRLDKMKAFADRGVAPFGHRYEVTDYAIPLKEEFAGLEGEDESNREVSLA